VFIAGPALREVADWDVLVLAGPRALAPVVRLGVSRGLDPRRAMAREPGMDPVTIGAVLAAVTAAAGRALGGQVWAGVSALVRRPFRHARAAGDGAAVVSGGGAELAALGQAPADERPAGGLTTAAADDGHLRALPGLAVPEEFTGQHGALEWLVAERPSLVAAVSMAAESGRDRAALFLPLLVAQHLAWRRRFDDWRAMIAISLDSSRAPRRPAPRGHGTDQPRPRHARDAAVRQGGHRAPRRRRHPPARPATGTARPSC
jgi:hypothetical protein